MLHRLQVKSVKLVIQFRCLDIKQKIAEKKYSNIFYLDKHSSKPLKNAHSKFISGLDINLHTKHVKQSSGPKIHIFFTLTLCRLN